MPDVLNVNDCDKLCFLLSNENICMDVARNLYDTLEKRRHVSYVT